MKKIFLFALWLVAFLSIEFVFFTPTQGKDSFSLKVVPPNLDLSVTPGQMKEAEIIVTNLSDTPLEVETELMNFGVENNLGVPKFTPLGESSHNPITIVPQKITLLPAKSEIIKVTINFPVDTEPGGNYKAIVFNGISSGGGQLGVEGSVAVPVLLAVSGEVSKTGEIKSFTVPTFLFDNLTKFKAEFENTGTVHYTTSGNVKLFQGSREVSKIDLKPHLILPKTTREFEGEWQAGFNFGRYKARLEIADGDGKVLTKEVNFLVLPWKETLIIFAWIVLIVAGILYYRHKKRVQRI